MKKILIVEDNMSMRFLLERIFKDLYNVKTADDGLTAMVLIRKGFVPDLIITDINMPSINGYELIMYLKKSNLYGHIPIVILSSSSSEEVKYEGIDSFIEFTLQKPFEPKELQQRVALVLKKHSYLTAVPSEA